MCTLGEGSLASAEGARAIAVDKLRALLEEVATDAELFGIADRGRLVAGTVATLVVCSGDPFELWSHAVHVGIGGVDQPQQSHHSLLLERYRTLPHLYNRARAGPETRRRSPVCRWRPGSREVILPRGEGERST